MEKIKLGILTTDENTHYSWSAISSNITSELFSETITVH